MSRIEFDDLENGESVELGDELNARFNALKSGVNDSMLTPVAWDADTQFVALDIVTHGGQLWRAKRDNLNVTPVAGDDWELLVEKGATGDTGAKGDTGDTGAQGIPGGSLNPRLLWATATAYAVDDDVQNGTRKSSYRCKLAHTSDAAKEPGVGASWQTYWVLYAQAGEKGEKGDKGDDGADGADGLNGIGWLLAWNGATAYTENDGVSHNGSSYVCILAHTNHEPPNATYWDVLAARGENGEAGTLAGAVNHSFTLGTDEAPLGINATLTIYAKGESSGTVTVGAGDTDDDVKAALEARPDIATATVVKSTSGAYILIDAAGVAEDGVFALPAVNGVGGGTLTIDFDADDAAAIQTKVQAITGYTTATVVGSGDYV